jgi:hypothetical protein
VSAPRRQAGDRPASWRRIRTSTRRCRLLQARKIEAIVREVSGAEADTHAQAGGVAMIDAGPDWSADPRFAPSYEVSAADHGKVAAILMPRAVLRLLAVRKEEMTVEGHRECLLVYRTGRYCTIDRLPRFLVEARAVAAIFLDGE